jgi:DNA mismatch endonuclease, patch repair protein
MQANRRTDTRPEVALRSHLHRTGLRFRKDYKLALPGRRTFTVDIAFTRLKLAVLVDGCFWHSCPTHQRLPRSNAEYWLPKLRRNAQRDTATQMALVAAGWQVLRIWEHEPVELAVRKVAQAVYELKSISDGIQTPAASSSAFLSQTSIR